MKSRKKDLRISRKSGVTGVGTSRGLQKATCASRLTSKSGARRGRPKTKLISRVQKNTKAPSEPDAHSSKSTLNRDIVSGGNSENYRRRRLDTSEYIKRRFLYDVPEPPRRPQRRPKSVQHSSVALTAVSSTTLSRRKHLAAKSSRVRGTKDRGRRMRAKNVIKRRTHTKKARYDRRHEGSSPQSHSPKQTYSWDFPEFLEGGSPQSYDGGPDIVTFDVRRNGISRSKCKLNFRQSVKHRTEKPERFSDSKSKGIRSRRTDDYFPQSFYSRDRSPVDAPYANDIIALSPDRVDPPVGQLRHLDMTFTDGFSNPSHSPVLPDRQDQHPSEDLEEEELLAPELSILTESASLATTSVPLVTAVPRGGCVLSNNANGAGGGSRRKSPVRPMQVLRTKTSMTANTLSPPFGVSAELNHSAKHGRRLPTMDNDRGENSLPVSYRLPETEPLNIDICLTGPKVNFHSTSLVQVTSSSTTGKSGSTTTRFVREHSLEDISQNGDSGRVAAQTSKGARSGKAALVKSLLLAHNAPSTRRRPTILRRNSGTSKPELEEEPKKTATQTMTALTSGSSHSRRSSKRSTTGEPAATTKLLQLITATSLASPSMTASEKLFGKRATSQKPSLVTNVTMPVVDSRYIDTVKAPVTTSSSCRYAVLRGSANGKRYIVLGNNAIFDRSQCAKKNITPAIPPPTTTSIRTPSADPPAEPSPTDLDAAETLLEGLQDPVNPEANSLQSATTYEISETDSMSTLVATALAAT